MKKLLFPILLLALLLSQSACHKYPDDIPDWLKEKIKGLEKETRWHKGCLNDHCMKIDEFKLNSETLYLFDPGYLSSYGYHLFIVYDLTGNEQCQWVPAEPLTACDSYSSADNIRRIWAEKN